MLLFTHLMQHIKDLCSQMHLCTNYSTLGLCRASLLHYYTTTATQLAADSALSKWCRAHRPPFSDPNTLEYKLSASKVPPPVPSLLLFHLYEFWAFTLQHNWWCPRKIFNEIPEIPASPGFCSIHFLRPFSSVSKSLAFLPQCPWLMRTLFSTSS